eukprot:2855862-Pleurochrysis_carterae.AAC.1
MRTSYPVLPSTQPFKTVLQNDYGALSYEDVNDCGLPVAHSLLAEALRKRRWAKAKAALARPALSLSL